MDTSEQYVEMCSKAVEIQEKWKPVVWDTYLDSTYGELVLFCGCIDIQYLPERRKVSFWLPRQDQLQEMLIMGTLPLAVYGFSHFVSDNISCGCQTSQFGSWEQLWLAYIMKEKYNKTWDGNDWKPLA